MNSKIGVLGCGWLGLPLALELIERGYRVWGTTTSQSKMQALEERGIQSYFIRLNSDSIEGPIDEFLAGLDILIINVPPALRRFPEASYYDKMMTLFNEVKKASVEKVVFVSSTSVYGKAEGEITEEDSTQPVTVSARQLVDTEQLYMKDSTVQTSVVRFGGLIGPDRHPVKHLAGRTDLTNGDEAVNLIHRDDCIHMIISIIQAGWWNEIFNGVYPDHPRKADYYREEALIRGLQAPSYEGLSGSKKGKIIVSKNFLNKNQSFFTSIHS